MVQLTPTGQQQPNLFCFQSKEVLTQLSRDVLKSKFYSILFDSTTDKTVSEQEAVFVLYFEPDPREPRLSGDHEPMVHVKLGFLSLENLTNSTSKELGTSKCG